MSDFGDFTLTATINHSGVLLPGGTLTISGGINDGPVQTLLTGSLIPGPGGTAFGFENPPGGNLFEFLFTITGGDPTIVNDFSGLPFGGVNLDAWFKASENDLPFDGTWDDNFNNSSSYLDGSSDVSAFAVPEPASLLLALTGGVWVAAARSRRLNQAG